MLVVNRRLPAAVFVSGWILLAAGAGCSRPERFSPLADVSTPLPEAVSLPPGFYPLAGQYDPSNPADHYHGWPRYIVGETDNMIMAYVPAQETVMGGGTDADEVPARHVRVNHFYIDICEVTNRQFERFVREAEKHGIEPRPSRRFADYHVRGVNDHHPVRNVSWFEANSYARWAGKLLPTEAQWEVAARGDDRRLYPWGNDEVLETTRYLCNSRTNRQTFDGYEFTAPVMSFAPGVSPCGAFNMAGNVWEWCADWYDPGRYAYPSEEDPATGLQRGTRAFGDANYPNPLSKDVRDARVGPLVGGQRVIRGGSFTDPIEKCRVDARAPAEPGAHQHNVGFRCVLPLPPAGSSF